MPSAKPGEHPNWAGVTRIPKGSAPDIDGDLGPNEWADAEQVSILVEPAWEVKVFLKHDSENLYFAFSGVEHNGKRLFPEVMIDARLNRGEQWSPGQLWLHVSQNLCEGNGEFNIYERAGVSQCSHQKAGWEANNPPNDKAAIEIRVSFEKMGLTVPKEKMIGLAFDVTDATGDAKQIFRYWPDSALITRPKTWGVGLLE